MDILVYKPAAHKVILATCVKALRQGKTVVYPTDTSYGIACDITNLKARAKFYKIKARTLKQPIHVVMPSLAYAKNVSRWNKAAAVLAKSFWPGPLSLILPLKQAASRLPEYLKIISAGTGTVGLRRPNNRIALDLARLFGKPIPATSANPSGRRSKGYDSYSSEDVIRQFSRQKHKPDIIIDVGKLPKRKSSTLVKIDGNKWEIIRSGPITKKQIQAKLNDAQI